MYFFNIRNSSLLFSLQKDQKIINRGGVKGQKLNILEDNARDFKKLYFAFCLIPFTFVNNREVKDEIPHRHTKF